MGSKVWRATIKTEVTCEVRVVTDDGHFPSDEEVWDAAAYVENQIWSDVGWEKIVDTQPDD